MDSQLQEASLDYDAKISNFINTNRSRMQNGKYVESIEFHCVLQNLPSSTRRIACNVYLPHSTSSQLHKFKFLCICDVNDILYKQGSHLIDEYTNDIILNIANKANLLVNGYFKHYLLPSSNSIKSYNYETNIIDICKNYYYTNEYQRQKIKSNSSNYVGIEIILLDQLRAMGQESSKDLIKWINKYDKIFIRRDLHLSVLRLFGPFLGRLRHVPVYVRDVNELKDRINDHKRLVSISSKIRKSIDNKQKQTQTTSLSCRIGDIAMNKQQLNDNLLCLICEIFDAVGFNSLKNSSKCWKYIGKINIKTTQGKMITVYHCRDFSSRCELSRLISNYIRSNKIGYYLFCRQ